MNRAISFGGYTADDLQRAMRVALARADLRHLRAQRSTPVCSPGTPLPGSSQQHASACQGRCGRSYELTDSGCLMPV